MKKNLKELVFILDDSTSMYNQRKDTIDAFNSMIEKQKITGEECLVSLVLFSDKSDVVFDRIPIKDVQNITVQEIDDNESFYGPTALLDAIGGAIHHIVNVHRYSRPKDVPEKTVFVINTDGKDNCSRRYTVDKVREMVRYEQERYGWTFLFLKADIDAVQTRSLKEFFGSRAFEEFQRYGICHSRILEMLQELEDDNGRYGNRGFSI